MAGKVKVNDEGAELSFIDSGRPLGNTYKTIVCIHGHTYHAQIFSRLFAYAEQENLRVIALNRRDYIGSSAFTATELRALHSVNDKLKNGEIPSHSVMDFLRDRGLEIARFLVWVIRELQIPPISQSGDEGGLALLGWSLGNVTTLAFLSNLRTYPRDIVETLEPYLRTFVMYELPDYSLGYARPQGGYHPLEDRTIPERTRGISTGKWVASYYSHPVYSHTNLSLPFDELATARATGIFVEEDDSRDVFPSLTSLEALQIRTPSPKEALRANTMNSFTARDFVQCADTKPHERSDKHLMRLPLEVLRHQMHHALYMGPEETLNFNAFSSDYAETSHVLEYSDDYEILLPRLKVQVLFGLASYWAVQWETWQLQKELDKVRTLNFEGMDILTRPVSFVPIPGENHFMHWDNPKKFVELCSDVI